MSKNPCTACAIRHSACPHNGLARELCEKFVEKHDHSHWPTDDDMRAMNRSVMYETHNA